MEKRKFTVTVVENGFLVEEVVPTSEEGPKYKSKTHVFHTAGAMCTYLTNEVQGEFVTDLDNSDPTYWIQRVVIAMLAAATRIRTVADYGHQWEAIAAAIEDSANELEDELAHGRPHKDAQD